MAILEDQNFLREVQQRYSAGATERGAVGGAVRGRFGTPHYGAGGQPLNEAARMLEQLDSGRRSGPPEMFSGGPAFMAGTDRREGESQADRFQRLADQFNARFGSEQVGGVQDVIDATDAVTGEPEEPGQPTFSFPMMDPMGRVAVEEDDGFAAPAFVSPRARPFWDFF